MSRHCSLLEIWLYNALVLTIVICTWAADVFIYIVQAQASEDMHTYLQDSEPLPIQFQPIHT